MVWIQDGRKTVEGPIPRWLTRPTIWTQDRTAAGRGSGNEKNPIINVVALLHHMSKCTHYILMMRTAFIYSAILSSWADSLLVACDSKLVTVAFYSAFLNTRWSGVCTALFGCYMAGVTWNCCHLGTFCVQHTAMHHVTSFHAKPYVQSACVFSCNLPSAFLAEWPGSFTCYCGYTGVERILK